MSPLTEQQARRRVRHLRAFYIQLGWYAAINIFLIVINLVTSPDHLWFYWVTIFWGIGIVAQAISLFGNFNVFGKDWEDKKVAELTKKK